jgi:TRAP-type C4-dicarboxylate transport system permease small subunit
LGAIERLDAAVQRGERAAVAAILAVMGLVVFLDVVYRVTPDPTDSPQQYVAILAGVTVVASLAWRSRGVRNPLPQGAGVGLVVTVVLVVYRVALPNGLMLTEPIQLQPQPLALALTLWLGMLGASLAAAERRHLAADIGSKLWPARLAPYAVAAGHVITAAFCVGVLVLAVKSTGQNFENWSATEHRGGVLSGTGIPKWLATASILYGMVALALRFSLEAWRVATGRVAIGGDDTLRQLGIEEPVEASK